MTKDTMLPADAGASGTSPNAAERAGHVVGTGQPPTFVDEHAITGGNVPSHPGEEVPKKPREQGWRKGVGPKFPAGI